VTSHNARPNSFALKILTSKLFDIRILQAAFADPAPRTAFRGMGGGGVPPQSMIFPICNQRFRCPRRNYFRLKSKGYAAPNRTDTSFDTPGSCIVTP